MKKTYIIFINIIIVILLFLLIEIFIYKNDVKSYIENNSPKIIPKFSYVLNKNFNDLSYLKDFFNGKNDYASGRQPDGLEYKNKEPIIIFGCSFGHGQYLKANQTISYKLAEALKRPIYNRCIPASSLQYMYYQTNQDYFYEQVPPTNEVIYIMILDHYRRMLVYFFDNLNIAYNIHYSLKGNDFVIDRNNIFSNFVKSLYLSKYINQHYVKNYINNPKNADELTDLTLKYLIETRNNLEKKWNRKINFSVILFQGIIYQEELTKKLKENNFKVFFVEKYINPDEIGTAKYTMLDNGHPQELLWDTLLNPIIKELNLE